MSSLFGSSSSSVKIPKTNLTQELEQTLAGYQATAGGFFDLNKQYSPQYTALNLQALAQTLTGELPLEAQSQQFLTGANQSLLQQYGLQGYQNLLQSNPGLAQSLGNANQFASSLTAPGSLYSSLQNTAQQQLGLGGSLSPQELTMIDQGAAAGASERGMFNTNQSLATDLLSRDSAYNQRLGQRIGWAQGIAGLGPQYNSALQGNAQLNQGVYNPYLNILGQSQIFGGGTPNPLSLMGTMNTSQLFNPLAGQDIFETNYNAQASAAIANANNSAAQSAGFTNLLGSLGSAAIMGAFLSDENLKKKDMRKVGETAEGIPIREWSYKGDKRRFVSPTAQDVEKVRPDAVITMPLTGHKLIDLRRANVPFYQKNMLSRAA